ncbi:hypothetical protein [Flagellimonas meishanensis]|uniref:hypothetical protein n=1 Tax=Flagellimonas meishanensis TaxID=2873264 RepID=UPI001CA6B9D6|nr:hypothetical protein [[Muricauda] meishanensis]
MKKLFQLRFTLLILCSIYSLNSLAQAPFTTLVKEPVLLKKLENGYEMYDIEEQLGKVKAAHKLKKEEVNFNIKKEYETILNEDDVMEPTNEVGFFKNSSLALNILSNSENRASINSQVLFYKINILTPVDEKPKNYKYNIPMMIISKLSTSYDSISGSSALDVLDYEAAPVTLRIMPSWKISKNETFKEQVLFGFYADARGINVQNINADDYSVEVVGSAGIGFTFTGNGEAGIYNEEGNYEKGNWLVSAMLQGAVGDEDVIQRLFSTDKDYVTSFQAYFAFNISDTSKFNLKIGYQHFFQETIGGTNNNFSIAIGI